jgi:hypothetical protein
VLSTSRSSAAGDRMFLLGQAFIPAVNARLLGSLLDQSRLVPRVLPPLGFIGAPLLVASAAAVLLGLVERVRAARDRHTPDRAVGVSLTVKGFRPSPITAGTAVNYIE